LNRDVIDYINKWIIKAGNDLLVAERELQFSDPVTDIICFHCQQAVEKYLKAYLIKNGVDFEKTHNVLFLREQCAEINKDFNDIDFKRLNFFGVTVRYPDDFYVPTIDETKEYIEIAKRVKNLVESVIHQVWD